MFSRRLAMDDDAPIVPGAAPEDKDKPILSSKFATLCPEDTEWSTGELSLVGPIDLIDPSIRTHIQE